MLTHPYTYWTIIWSALGLGGSTPRSYSCFTAGQVTLIPPSPRPSPRERPHVKPTHGRIHIPHHPPHRSLPSCMYQAQHKVFWAHNGHTPSEAHLLKESSAACGCQTETCSQEMRESALTAISLSKTKSTITSDKQDSIIEHQYLYWFWPKHYCRYQNLLRASSEWFFTCFFHQTVSVVIIFCCEAMFDFKKFAFFF